MHCYLINDGNFRVTERNENGVAAAATLLACRQLLIKTDSGLILIDAGIGNKIYEEPYFRKFDLEQPRRLLTALTAVGAQPEDIDMLILTHLHFDHVGGYGKIEENGRISTPFTSARLIVQQQELEHAVQEMKEDGNSYVAQNLIPVLNSTLLERVDGDLELYPSITVSKAIGHTGGNQLVRFELAGQIYYFAGDLLPTPYHINVSYNPPGIDHQPEVLLLNKTALLERLLIEDAIVIFNHSPAISAGRITGCQNGRWQFKNEKLKENPAWTIL